MVVKYADQQITNNYGPWIISSQNYLKILRAIKVTISQTFSSEG